MENALAIDELYYIMDYNENYYRTDSSDQVVVSENKDEETFFPFEDAEEISTVRELTVAEIRDEVEKSMTEYDISKIDWEEYLTHFTLIANSVQDYRNKLVEAESDADQKICDVLHYIEFCDVDAGESENLVELIRVCRDNRRSIKDELFKLDAFQKSLGTNKNITRANGALKSINGLENRKYTPRKFPELFEGSEIRKKQRTIAKIGKYVSDDNNDERLHQQFEEENMNKERLDTIFDGKRNDWMAFAVQRAEFYKNIGRYITNLRIDIDEIDNTISDLMNEVETINCNVAQGYKMFKRLKELRLARKEKERELECLYILTEHFDLDAMADECESNKDAISKFLYGDSDDNMSEDIEDDDAYRNIINL